MVISFYMVYKKDSVCKAQNHSMAICSSKEDWRIVSKLLLICTWSKLTMKWSLTSWSKDNYLRQENSESSQISIHCCSKIKHQKWQQNNIIITSWMRKVQMETIKKKTSSLSASHVTGTNTHHRIILMSLEKRHRHAFFKDENSKVKRG